MESFKDLEIGVPFVVGAMNNYRLEKMEPLGDYMLRIDPNSDQVKFSHQ